MKIILSTQFFETLDNLSADQQSVVINTCKELSSLDNEQIETYQLPPDTPSILLDVVSNMKKRAASARRRRERRLTTIPAVAEKTDKVSTSSQHCLDEFTRSLKLILNNFDNFTDKEIFELSMKTVPLVINLSKFMETTQPDSEPIQEESPVRQATGPKRKKKHPKTASPTSYGRRLTKNKTQKVSINHFLPKRRTA